MSILASIWFGEVPSLKKVFSIAVSIRALLLFIVVLAVVASIKLETSASVILAIIYPYVGATTIFPVPASALALNADPHLKLGPYITILECAAKLIATLVAT